MRVIAFMCIGLNFLFDFTSQKNVMIKLRRAPPPTFILTPAEKFKLEVKEFQKMLEDYYRFEDVPGLL